MGMLMHRHRVAQAERERAEADKAPARPRRQRRRSQKPTTPPEQTSVEGSDYTELSDEQVAEAYAVTFPEGEATERDAQVTELRALNVNRDSFTADPE